MLKGIPKRPTFIQWALLKIAFLFVGYVTVVLKCSCMPYTLCFSVRPRLANE
jgi:hypothetical protein